MLRIRLSRGGQKNHAKFRVTVADGRRAPSGKFIEILGHYNPHTKERVFKAERVKYWLSKGAKPSNTVHNFLVEAGILKGEKVTSWRPKKKEMTEEEKQAAAEATAVKEEAETEEKANKSETEAKAEAAV